MHAVLYSCFNISVRIVSVIYSLKMSACSNNPIIIAFPIVVVVIIGLVVLAVILASYGTVITFFYQRNKRYQLKLKRNLNSKCNTIM